MKPGSGRLDLFGWAKEYRDEFSAGAGIDYEHRINDWASGYGSGRAGYSSGSGMDYEGLLGLRMRW